MATAIETNERVDPLATVWKKHGYKFDDFTPAERACVSGKISTLVKEGYDQDQAMAIAIKHCAPGKSKSEKASLRADLRIGGKYTAIDNGDGTFDIKGVPVFAEVPAGAKRNKKAIGKDWLDAALLKNREREQEGHLPPVHLGHSDEIARKPVYAGKLRLTETKQIKYQGNPVWASFADILGMPSEVFERVKKGFVPYRSVEIHDWDNPEIDSMALMDTDVPFFRMEMMTVGKILKRDAEMFLGRPSLAVACRLADERSMVVMFKMDDDKTGDEKVGDKENGAGKKEGEPVSEAVDERVNSTADEGALPPVVEGKEKMADVTESEGHERQEASTLGMIVDLLQQVLRKLSPQEPAQEKLEPVDGYSLVDDQENKENYMPEDKKPAAPAMMDAGKLEAMIAKAASAAAEKAVAVTEAKFSAKIDKMAGDLAAERQEKSRRAKFEAYLEHLKGRSIGEATKKALFRMIELGVSDDEIKATVEGWKSEFPAEPPADADRFEAMLAGRNTMTSSGAEEGAEEAIRKFSAKHPEAAAWARQNVRAFQPWKQASGTDIGYEEALETAYRAASMSKTKRI